MYQTNFINEVTYVENYQKILEKIFSHSSQRRSIFDDEQTQIMKFRVIKGFVRFTEAVCTVSFSSGSSNWNEWKKSVLSRLSLKVLRSLFLAVTTEGRQNRFSKHVKVFNAHEREILFKMKHAIEELRVIKTSLNELLRLRPCVHETLTNKRIPRATTYLQTEVKLWSTVITPEVNSRARDGNNEIT